MSAMPKAAVVSIVLAAALSAGTAPLVAQQPFFESARVQEARDSFALFINGQPRGAYSITVSREADNYRVRSVMTMPAANVREDHDFAFSNRTLMPTSHTVRQATRGGEVVTVVKVADGRAKGSTSAASAGSAVIDIALPERTIDDEALPVLLPTLDFTPALTMRFNTLDFAPAQILGNELRVLGIETVTVPAGTFEAWHITIKYSTSPQPVTMFVTTQQPRRLVLVRQGPLELQLVNRM